MVKHCDSVPSVAARGLDRAQLLEVEVNDHLQRLASDALAQGFRETVEPGGIFGLQCDQFSDGGTPALRPGTAGCRSDRRRWWPLCGGAPCAVAGLALGVAE